MAKYFKPICPCSRNFSVTLCSPNFQLGNSLVCCALNQPMSINENYYSFGYKSPTKARVVSSASTGLTCIARQAQLKVSKTLTMEEPEHPR